MADNSNKDGNFSDAEKEAMRARAKELKAEARAAKKREVGEQAVMAAIKEMPEADRELAEKIHQIVSEVAPELWPKTWYGMPAYSIEGKAVICFFQAASKFDARYATFGFNDAAKLDDGNMWEASFAVRKIGEAEAKRIRELVKKAVS